MKDVSLSFFTETGEQKVLDGVSLSIKEGEIMGLVGESGSGKSMTACSIMGITPPMARWMGGTIEFNGRQIHEMKESQLEKIRGKEAAMVPQSSMACLNPVYTIGRQIGEFLRIHTGVKGAAARERSVELLKLVGIQEPERRLKQYPHELSGGMRQRVVIAMALACEPRLLIADEPTTALDVTIQAQILELLEDLRRKMSMSILLVTHDMGVAAWICDTIAVMHEGKVVECGTAEDIFYHPVHEYTKGLLEHCRRIT